MAGPRIKVGGEKRILRRKPDGKRPLRRSRGRWQYITIK